MTKRKKSGCRTCKPKPKKLTFEQYSDFVSKMASKASTRSLKAKIGTGGLGMAGEAGEIADLTKKILFHGLKWNDDTRHKMKKELGDTVWYLAFICRHVLGVTLEDVMQTNMDKLNERYKSGKFTTREFMKKEDCKKE